MVALPPMLRPAVGPGDHRRLGVLRGDDFGVTTLDALPRLLRPGDLLVVNDAATLPAAIRGHAASGAPLELRLARRLGPDRWQVAVLGEGTWRTPTELRAPPPPLSAGDLLHLDGGLEAHVLRVLSARLVEVRLGAGWAAALLRAGEPVRYSYLGEPAPLAAFQTAFAARPWASESPSAGLPLGWADLLGLRRAGVALASVTHAAGLSSIDGGELDRRLPLPERSDVPARTVAAVKAARARGGRVVAVGTTVVRALEGRVAEAGALVPGEAETSLVLGPDTPLHVVDGVLSKLHAPGESHFELLTAFAPRAALALAVTRAGALGFVNHEFGDTLAVLPR